MYGCIAGSIWETLPMSVDARAIMVSGPELNRRPAAVARRS